MQSVRNSGPADIDRPSAGMVVAFGRINYFVDGNIKAPYGAFRPKWPAPVVMAIQLESGLTFHTAAVSDDDGSFYWELPPGSYVITRIGVGQSTDDTYIAWPRIAFRVPAGPGAAYLGHLQLAGTSYLEHQVLSTGKAIELRGIRYRFRVLDELEAQAGAPGSRAGKIRVRRALMFEDPEMPVGDRFAESWRASREELRSRIFGTQP